MRDETVLLPCRGLLPKRARGVVEARAFSLATLPLSIMWSTRYTKYRVEPREDFKATPRQARQIGSLLWLEYLMKRMMFIHTSGCLSPAYPAPAL